MATGDMLDTDEQLSTFADRGFGALPVRVLPADTPVIGGAPCAADPIERLNAQILALQSRGLAERIKAQFAEVLGRSDLEAQNPVALVIADVFADIVERCIEHISDLEAARSTLEARLQGAIARINSTTERMIALEGSNAKLEQAATTDALTGLLNRAGFDENGGKLFEYQKQQVKPLSFAFLDLDYFKYVNDAYGHAAGDYILREVAGILKDERRFSDGRPARIGGEELVILLPDTDLDGAGVFIERLRKAIEDHEFVRGGQIIRVTASIGAVQANFDDPGETLATLQSRADTTMYHAKKNAGRNAAVTFGNQGGGVADYKCLSPERRYVPTLPEGYVRGASDPVPNLEPEKSPEN